MRVVTLYKTSRGLFADYEIAKAHRAKDMDPNSPRFRQRETIETVQALQDDAFGNPHYYELRELKVDSTRTDVEYGDGLNYCPSTPPEFR